jgi:threonine dehydratase
VPIGLADIEAAARRIGPGVIETPVRLSTWLNAPGGLVQLKLEVVQPTSSYKIRGAWNACARLRERADAEDLRLVTASAGNHGQALAYAARAFRFPLTVFVSSEAPRTKLDAIRYWEAELRECRDYDAAEREAKAFAASGGGLYISPYSHPDVIAGAGTVGLELYDQQPTPQHLGAVVVPMGGGGLISGIGIALKALSPSTKIVGVEVAASCPFTRSLEAGRLVTIDVKPSLADGLIGNLDPDTITLDIVREVVDEIVVVEEDELRRALAGVVTHEHLVVEGAAATGPAALLAGKVQADGPIAVILSGANIDSDALVSVLRP